MSDIHSDQYWDRFWEDYPEQVSKDLEGRKILHYLDLIGREVDILDLDVSKDLRKHLLFIYDLLDDSRRELTTMKEGRHIPTYRIAK